MLAFLSRKPEFRLFVQPIIQTMTKYSSILFTTALTLIVLVLTQLGISGTSIGFLNDVFHGKDVKDPSLVYGQPRPIRSDEFTVSTPWTIAQAQRGFPVTNHLFGLSGQNLILYDIPVKDFTLIFKPHHWGFFLLPIEQAFAYKWWFRGALFIISAYLVLLRISRGDRLFSMTSSLALFFMPFVQWWYSTTMMDILTYFFFAFEILIRLVRFQTNTALFLYSCLFAYCAVSILLFFYPPIQGSLGIIFALFALFFFWQERHSITNSRLKLLGLSMGLVTAVFILVGAIFYFQNRTVLQTTMNTIYPGKRINYSKGPPLAFLIGGVYNIQLLRDYAKIPGTLGLGPNQSEAAGFFFYGLFLLPILIGRIGLSWFKKAKVDTWEVVLSLSFLCFLFWELLGLPAGIGQLPILSSIPPFRLIMALGVLNLLMTSWYLYQSQATQGKLALWGSIAYATMIFVFIAWFGFFLRSEAPEYIRSSLKIILISGVVSLSCFALLRQHRIIYSLLLLIFAFLSTFNVNPLYRGLGEYTSGKLIQAANEIDQGDSNHSYWILYGTTNYQNLLQAAGIHALSGVYYYPDFALWQSFDPNGQFTDVYNRYSRVQIVASKDRSTYFEILRADSFKLALDPCSSTLVNLRVKYHVFDSPNQSSCLKEIKRVIYPAITFFIYEREE